MDREDDLTIAFNASDPDTMELEEAFYGAGDSELPFELALMAAAIRHAIYEQDLRWINGEDGDDHLFAFKSCCENLGVDHLAARKALNAKIKARPVKLRSNIQRHETLKGDIEDIPGREFTHSYGRCPDGMRSSECQECRQRYNRYHKALRRAARLRAQGAERLAEAS